jgi:hypothetical protein
MSEEDLWNQPIGKFKRKTPKPSGHAGKPGSGKEGETCGTCKHLTRLKYAKTYLKCELTRAQWTSGPASDVRAKDAACWKWEEKL